MAPDSNGICPIYGTKVDIACALEQDFKIPNDLAESFSDLLVSDNNRLSDYLDNNENSYQLGGYHTRYVISTDKLIKTALISSLFEFINEYFQNDPSLYQIGKIFACNMLATYLLERERLNIDEWCISRKCLKDKITDSFSADKLIEQITGKECECKDLFKEGDFCEHLQQNGNTCQLEKDGLLNILDVLCRCGRLKKDKTGYSIARLTDKFKR